MIFRWHPSLLLLFHWLFYWAKVLKILKNINYNTFENSRQSSKMLKKTIPCWIKISHLKANSNLNKTLAILSSSVVVSYWYIKSWVCSWYLLVLIRSWSGPRQYLTFPSRESYGLLRGDSHDLNSGLFPARTASWKKFKLIARQWWQWGCGAQGKPDCLTASWCCCLGFTLAFATSSAGNGLLVLCIIQRAAFQIQYIHWRLAAGPG